jgi:hypothetical protein
LTLARLRVTFPPVSSDASPPRERDNRERIRLEKIVPELVKKLLDVGVEKLAEGPENLRQLLSELKLPKEVILLLAAQLDDTKRDIARVLARELREFLERASLADELTRLLSGLSLEIKTQIRFVPSASPAGRPRPEVRTNVGVHVESEQTTEPTVTISEVSDAGTEQPLAPSSSHPIAEANMPEQERTK